MIILEISNSIAKVSKDSVDNICFSCNNLMTVHYNKQSNIAELTCPDKFLQIKYDILIINQDNTPKNEPTYCSRLRNLIE